MGMLSRAGRKIRSASTLSALEIGFIIPVFILLGLARLAIILLPFNRYARRLGKPIGINAEPMHLTQSKAERAFKIGRVVRLCAKVTPWHSLCLAQAMVATTLLRIAGIPYHVYFGLRSGTDAQSPDPLAAHAWVRSAGRNLTGGQNVDAYTVVMVFEHKTQKGS